MGNFLKFIKALDAVLGVFLALCVAVIFLLLLLGGNLSTYWPFPGELTAAAAFTLIPVAVILYPITRIICWVAGGRKVKNPSAVAGAPVTKGSDSNTPITFFGLAALGIIVVVFILLNLAISHVGS